VRSNKTILVIDDEPDVVTFLTTILEDAGFATVSARDGQEAMEQVQKSPPDLITLDISMPNRTGVRFYRDVKENDAWKSIPVIMVTGVTDEFQQFISTRRQVPPPEAYISKPVEPGELVETVKRLLAMD
jgi:CheY-like chemotaxis protein